MAHSEQKVAGLRLEWGGRVGEESQVKAPGPADGANEAGEFVGKPEVPLTDDDVNAARSDAIGKAMRWLGEEQMKLLGPQDEQRDRVGN